MQEAALHLDRLVRVFALAPRMLFLVAVLAASACSGESFFSSGDASTDSLAPVVANDAGSTGDGGMRDSDAVDGRSDASAPCPQGKGPRLVRVDPGNGAPPFCIDATEVTKAHYTAFLDAVSSKGFAQPAECAWNTTFVPGFDWPATGREEHPVNNVDWCDARAYCEWAGKRLCGSPSGGASKAATGSGSAWYLACAGAANTTYPYGSMFEAAVCNGCASQGICGKITYNKTTPVASKPDCTRPGSRLFDMSGNVREWEDLCASDAGASAPCAARGGGWPDVAGDLQCQSSSLQRRDAILGETGIRCCNN